MSRKLICFDLGGVVVRICSTWFEACERAGIEPREMKESEEFYRLLDQYQRGEVSYAGFVENIARLSRGVFTPQEVEVVHQAWVYEEYGGVADLITRIKDAGFKTAVLSNTNERHWEKMMTWQTLPRVDYPFASHQMGKIKPDPDIYKELEKETGYGSHEIIFFDDLSANISEARVQGWDARLIDPAGDPKTQMERVLVEAGVLGASA